MTEHPVKCACKSCHCAVAAGAGVRRDGKVFCSQACAYDCTETTCVCVHERCDERTDAASSASPPVESPHSRT